MIRDGGRGGPKRAVIDKRMMEECIYIPGHGDDAGRDAGAGIGGGGARGKTGGGPPLGGRRRDDEVHLYEVECLMMSYRSIGRISNLVGVDRLTKLHLDNNYIESIENLGELVHLKWLDLSFNRITKIQGLEKLTQLENLSLYSNQITTVTSGLDSQFPTLMCLSLGKNQIETGLEDIAKYLRKCKQLRMLTLSGNKLEKVPHYRDKILSHMQNLKFFDHKLVTADEVAKAEGGDNLQKLKDEDAREAKEAEEAKIAADKEAEYAAYNCPDETRLVDTIFESQPEILQWPGFQMKQIFELENVKDKMGSIIETYKTDFTTKAKELTDKMKDIKKEKDKCRSEYTITLEGAKAQCDHDCRKQIALLEKEMAKVIPFGLRVRHASDDVDEAAQSRALEALKRNIDKLKTFLLEMEADQFDAYEALREEHEKDMLGHKDRAKQTIESAFQELNAIEKDLLHNLNPKFMALADEMGARDAQGTADAIAAGGDSALDTKLLTQRLLDREGFMQALTLWHEHHGKELDKLDQRHQTAEEDQMKHLKLENARKERERNRNRVGEVHAYIERLLATVREYEAGVEA